MRRAANWRAPYRSARGLGITAAVLIGIATILLAAGAVLDLQVLRAIDRLASGGLVLDAEIEVIVARQETTARVWSLAFFGAGITFLVWFYRAYANLPSLGARDLRFAKGWAFWGWVVPILGFWRPKQIINDVWRASDPDLPKSTTQWRGRLAPAYWIVWWIALLLMWRPSPYAEGGDGSLVAQREAVTVGIADDVIGLLAGILAIGVVLTTTMRQEERARRLKEARRDVLAARHGRGRRRPKEGRSGHGHAAATEQ